MRKSWVKTALSKPLNEHGICEGPGAAPSWSVSTDMALHSWSVTYRVSAESGTVSNLT